MPEVDEAVKKGVAFLESAQQTDGSFPTYLSRTRRPFRVLSELSTTFTPALMLSSLAAVDETDAVRNKLVAWLLTQKSADWSFNYWPANAAERRTRPYPDDLDDTFCALIGLYLYDPKLIDSVCLAKVVQQLIAAEQQVGGPYRTWLAAKDAAAWQDIDVAVNCNIAYFLRLVAQPLPNLTRMMEQAIVSRNFVSPYYPVSYVVAYYLARAYRGKLQTAFARYLIKKRRQGYWGTPGQTALTVSALSCLGCTHDMRTAADYLLRQQLPDGSWPAEALWLDEMRAARKYFAGSPALTTAFVLEALAAVRQRKTAPSSPREPDTTETRLRAEVTRHAESGVKTLGEPLRRQAVAVLRRVERGDKDQHIALLPRIAAQSLNRTSSAANDLLVTLGAANLYGWAAYTIYDDFLDDEGDPQYLPVANVALRRSLRTFEQALPGNALFQKLVRRTFDRIDAANAWEVARCRFATDKNTIAIGTLPKYRQVTDLAERSLGHALTPVGVLADSGIPADDSRVVLLRRGLQHYLAGRQLQDDLHDWQQDVRQGHISYVVAYLLQELNIKPGRHLFKTLLPRMEHQFWHHSLSGLCARVTRQAALSRQAYQRSGLIKPSAPLYRMLDVLEASMHRTLQEQEKAKQFLDAYRK